MEDQLSGGTLPPTPEVGRPRPDAMPAEAPLRRAHSLSAAVHNEMNIISFIEKQIDQYKVEIHKKYSIPAACLIFVLIGAPLGIMARRGGFGIAATLSLGFFVLYWAFLVGGEKLADRNIMSPFWGMWSANILLGILGIYLTLRIGRETVVINWSVLQRALPRRWRTTLEDEPRTSSFGV